MARQSYKTASPPTSVQSLYYSDCTVVGGVTGLYSFGQTVYLTTPNILKITISKCQQLDQLDKRSSYSTIQPKPFLINNMKVGIGGCFLDYWTVLSNLYQS